MSHIVLAKAWNNGKFLPNGGGYGIRLTNYFKDEYLDINWVSITLELELPGLPAVGDGLFHFWRAGKNRSSLPSTPTPSGAMEESCAAASSENG